MRTLVFFVAAAALFYSCGGNSSKKVANNGTSVTDSITFAGKYEIPREHKYKWEYQQVMVIVKDSAYYRVKIYSLKAGKDTCCNFSMMATPHNDSLFIPLEWNGKKVKMMISSKNDTVSVGVDDFDNRYALSYFCCGGGSLMGHYVPVK